MHRDAKGYYAILGVQPGATQALIRAAYRVRAMELHPDRNTQASATQEFQALQEAFACLSNEARREAYDKDNDREVGNSEQATSRGDRGKSERSEGHSDGTSQQHRAPVVCGFCGAITAQPRFREFLTVTSFVVTSRRTSAHGIYCVKCEKKKAAIATGITLALGWWGVYGFFWTLDALAKNLGGAWRFAEQDARLLCMQALYFDSIGKIGIARAVAIESHAMTLSDRKLSREQKRRAKLGYEVTDSM